MKTAQYRFINGSLFEYNEASHAYIHVYTNASHNTKKKAIEAYELSQNW